LKIDFSFGISKSASAWSQVAYVDGVWIFIGRQDGQAEAEPGPGLGDDDAVLRIAGLIADGAGEAGANLSGVEDGTELGNVLRALVVDPTDAVLKKEHGEGAGRIFLFVSGGFNVANVEKHSIDEPARLGEEAAPGLFEFLFSRSLVQDEPQRQASESGKASHTGHGFPCVGVQVGHLLKNSELSMSLKAR
jgi:hypothetical protein